MTVEHQANHGYNDVQFSRYDSAALTLVLREALEKIQCITADPTLCLSLGCGNGREINALKQLFPNSCVIGTDLDDLVLKNAQTAGADIVVKTDVTASPKSLFERAKFEAEHTAQIVLSATRTTPEVALAWFEIFQYWSLMNSSITGIVTFVLSAHLHRDTNSFNGLSETLKSMQHAGDHLLLPITVTESRAYSERGFVIQRLDN